MSTAPAEAPPRYWIFQARRERYDLAERLVEGEVADWELNQYRDRIRAGDAVFLWNTGNADNLLGWGRVADIHQPTREGDSPRVSVEYVARFDRPLSRDEMAGEPFLEALTILRTPTGTNFRLTTLEARRLVQLIGDRGDRPPPEPERFAEGTYPFGALQDLRLSGDVAGLVAALIREFDPGGTMPLDRLAVAALRHGLGDKLLEPVLRRTTGEQLWSVRDVEPTKLSPSDEAWFRVGLDDGSLEAFELARRVAIATTRRETIALRHLIGALILLRRRSTPQARADRVDATLMEMGIDPDLFARSYFHFLEEQAVDAEPARWAELRGGELLREYVRALRSGAEGQQAGSAAESGQADGDDQEADSPARTEVGTEPGSPSTGQPEGFSQLLLRPPILSDRAQAEDFLELQDEHRAFARLLADEKTDLPLAIGLFGHWGSGKTTFLENLEHEIGTRNDPSDPGAGFHVAQIQFNAWHYMESDVWASFADHIFRSLDREVRGRRDAEEKLSNLISKLEAETRLESKLQRQLANVIDEIGDKEVELAEAEKVQKERSGTFETSLTAFVNSATSATTQKFLLDTLLDAEKYFGSDDLANLRTEAGKAGATYAKLEAEIKRARDIAVAITKPTTLQLLRKYWWLALAFLFLGAGVYFLVGQFKEEIAWLVAGATSVLGALLSKAPLVTKWLDRGAKLRDRADELLAGLARDQEEALLKDPKLAKLRAEVLEADRAREGVEGDLERCRDRKKALEAELSEKPPEERVLEFIKTRAETTDYNERLGTLAIVRRDFQKLSDLLREQHRSQTSYLPSIRRIVLYIDDLDRCPWDRVMEVLEAVHLLLAFPLFAVVVAVDARWVRRSVTQHLERMERGNGRSGADGAAGDSRENGQPKQQAPLFQRQDINGQATPQEYLEKIIQVPFWLKPLEKGERSGLLLKMLEGSAADDDAFETAATPARSGSPEADAGTGTEQDVVTALPDDGGQDEALAGQSVMAKANGGSDEAGKAEAGMQSSPESEAANKPRAVSAPVAPGLDDTWSEFQPRTLTPFETAFFPVLDPLLGRTPRSVKRFLSLYGICRAFRPETARPEFSGENGVHRSVQLLYALQTGWPEIAFPFFRILVDQSDYSDFFELVDTVEALRVSADQNSRPKEFDEGNPQEWDRMFAALGDARRAFENLPPDARTPIEVNPMLDWLPFVTRFAFADWSASRHAF